MLPSLKPSGDSRDPRDLSTLKLHEAAGYTPIYYADAETNTAAVNAGDYNLSCGERVSESV